MSVTACAAPILGNVGRTLQGRRYTRRDRQRRDTIFMVMPLLVPSRSPPGQYARRRSQSEVVREAIDALLERTPAARRPFDVSALWPRRFERATRGVMSPTVTGLLLVRSHGVATVTIDRPKVLNALDADTLRELLRALREIRRDQDVRAVVITGAGDKAFSAGADIAAMAAMSPAEGHAYSRLGHEVMSRLEALEVPVVAAVNGVALGGGCELALACDLIVASSKARLGVPEINLGLIPGFGGTQRLVARVGQGRAREMIYLGQPVGAEEAGRIGLVDRVVPPERLAEEAAALAKALAEKAPVAMRQAKRATAVAVDADRATGCRFEVEAFGVTFGTDDRVEGLRAFLDKRPPVWKAR